VNNLARHFQKLILICVTLLVFSDQTLAADLYTEAARELVEKIMKNAGPLKDAGFTFQSRSSLGTKESIVARKALENELRGRGVRLAKNPQSAVTIKVTLSENLQQYVWIAEIQQAQTSSLLMTTQPRQQEPSLETTLRMAIQVKLLFEQNDPMLDISWQNDEMLVLEPQRLVFYRRKNGQWELDSSTPLKISAPFPRDIRGKLSYEGDAIQVHLPGLSCSGTIRPSFTLNCSQEATPWIIGLNGLTPKYQRNYFILENLPPFFSAAAITDDGADLTALAGLDGRTYLFEKSATQAGVIDSWGGDIAGVEAGCGSRRQILAALANSALERGAIQAFEIVHRKAVAVSSIYEFPGPVTALWPVPAQDAAIAVTRDLKTGKYAAFHLSISCGR
jgi:hypothetical protein